MSNRNEVLAGWQRYPADGRGINRPRRPVPPVFTPSVYRPTGRSADGRDDLFGRVP